MNATCTIISVYNWADEDVKVLEIKFAIESQKITKLKLPRAKWYMTASKKRDANHYS